MSGLGLGTVIAPLLNIILAGVPGRDAGSASGVLTTFQQLGGAIGVAIVGVVFFGLLSSRAASCGRHASLRSCSRSSRLPTCPRRAGAGSHRAFHRLLQGAGIVE